MNPRFRPARAACLLLLVCQLSPSGLAQVPAFPGAEGFGRFATGGRGGEVYPVRNLDDNGPGSFRDAVSRPGRIVVFEVGGIIRLSSRVTVSSNLTIAGQTAPGGVSLYGNGVSFSGANNTITRYVAFRMGVGGDPGKDALTIAHGHDMIFDHVSVSWGRDENFSISGPVTNVTIQDSIIAQGLQPHSCGGLIQTDGGVSILRTLYIDNHTRNPKVKGRNQFVNNVIYNWGGGGGYILGDSAGPSYANVVGNYFINGPSTRVSAFSRGNLNFRIYAAENFQDSNRDGVLNGTALQREAFGTVAWQERPFDYPPVRELNAKAAVARIIEQAGASRPRDEVDRALIAELSSYGSSGTTISREPELLSMRGAIAEPPPLDADRDGMADDWERAMGLNPSDAQDRNQLTRDHYTRVEEYLNGLLTAESR
jgi:pectate lyase